MGSIMYSRQVTTNLWVENNYLVTGAKIMASNYTLAKINMFFGGLACN